MPRPTDGRPGSRLDMRAPLVVYTFIRFRAERVRGAGTTESGDVREICLDVAESCVLFRVRKASRAITQVFDEELRPTGLKGTQVALLVPIAMAGPARKSDLAGLLGMDRTTLTRNLRGLLELGIVEEVIGEDRRERLVQLTPAGEQRLKDGYTYWRAAQRRISQGLGEEHRVQLNHLLEMTAARFPVE